eukprot:gnl/MRDRNA2_/MRDRNA2_53069_c0_seq1.p1 gnl/MRDRNA2_/MRDRNA2_53069_c0~~gnl/MRDRNA2_/MRDRNA2_53069_c0_seq1.p1  ORF type:complete len:150 (-),score=15.40 gnl/MRDRNA2_/MRDRNA2_53069_c0_seq1:10-459(-)
MFQRGDSCTVFLMRLLILSNAPFASFSLFASTTTPPWVLLRDNGTNSTLVLSLMGHWQMPKHVHRAGDSVEDSYAEDKNAHMLKIVQMHIACIMQIMLPSRNIHLMNDFQEATLNNIRQYQKTENAVVLHTDDETSISLDIQLQRFCYC